MLEKFIERKLVKRIKEIGGMCIKLDALSMAGIPDRLILMKNSRVGFVEVKRKGEKPRPLQVKRIKTLRGLGFKCFVLDDVNQIGEIIDEIQST